MKAESFSFVHPSAFILHPCSSSLPPAPKNLLAPMTKT